MDIPTPLHHIMNHPDSAESSPRSRPGENWDELLPPVPGAKLRLMCSYGGHIIPRPHDKSLCYVGGDTRMVVVDRNSSLSSFSIRLSRTLIGGRTFTLKYQLPNEDLDSLISVTTDEDLENMIEENDRINSVSLSLSLSKPGRLRLFLFPTKPETAISMGSLLDDAKSETWFVDALNNAALSRGESDSAAMDCLLEGDDRCPDIGNQNVSPLGNNIKQVVGKVSSSQDVQSITTDDAPVVETTSSFDSISSAPSVAYLKPIKVSIDQDQTMVGLDEQLSNLNLQKQEEEEELVLLSAPTPPISTVIAASVPNDSTNRDNERLPDHRKPPLPLQLVQKKKGLTLTSDAHHNLPSPDPDSDSNPSGVCNLPSPDSVASDNSSTTSAVSFSKQQHNYRDSSTPPPPHSPNEPNQSNQIEQTSHQQMVQHMIQDPRHQFIQQTPTHYMDHLGHHHPIMSLPSYYATKQQPVHLQSHSQNHVYFLQPFNQNQPYNTYPISDTPSPNPSMTVSPVYQTKQELPPNVYITNPTSLVQTTTGQYHQPQYVGLPQQGQNYYLSQSITAGPASGSNNYQYAAHSGHDDPQTTAAAYHSPSMFTTQYQTINPATAVLLAQANSTQVPTNSDNKTS